MSKSSVGPLSERKIKYAKLKASGFTIKMVDGTLEELKLNREHPDWFKANENVDGTPTYIFKSKAFKKGDPLGKTWWLNVNDAYDYMLSRQESNLLVNDIPRRKMALVATSGSCSDDGSDSGESDRGDCSVNKTNNNKDPLPAPNLGKRSLEVPSDAEPDTIFLKSHRPDVAETLTIPNEVADSSDASNHAISKVISDTNHSSINHIMVAQVLKNNDEASATTIHRHETPVPQEMWHGKGQSSRENSEQIAWTNDLHSQINLQTFSRCTETSQNSSPLCTETDNIINQISFPGNERKQRVRLEFLVKFAHELRESLKLSCWDEIQKTKLKEKLLEYHRLLDLLYDEISHSGH